MMTFNELLELGLRVLDHPKATSSVGYPWVKVFTMALMLEVQAR